MAIAPLGSAFGTTPRTVNEWINFCSEMSLTATFALSILSRTFNPSMIKPSAAAFTRRIAQFIFEQRTFHGQSFSLAIGGQSAHLSVASVATFPAPRVEKG
jgi:hypothetical protein